MVQDRCALGQQPLSIVIEADQSFSQLERTSAITAADGSDFFSQLHKTDVIAAMCETERDHGTLVGYGTERGTEEWHAIFLFSVSRQMCPLGGYSNASCRVLVSIAFTYISKPSTTCVVSTHSFALLVLCFCTERGDVNSQCDVLFFLFFFFCCIDLC